MGAKLYAIQPSFVGGEISQDVASRVDLDKYQMALLQAENAVIRPYGAVRKRAGTLYCGKCRYSNRKAMLYKFDFSVEISYLLEIGECYLRIWRDGKYLGVELPTPYNENDFSKLRFIQNVDVMYICSADYPVYKLTRYTEQDWDFEEVEWTMPPFGEINKDEELTITPSARTGDITLTASKEYFTASMEGDWMKLSQYLGGSHVSVSTSSGSVVSDSIVVGNTWKIITHGTWSEALPLRSLPIMELLGKRCGTTHLKTITIRLKVTVWKNTA